jgi:hypothetical protein
VPCRSDFGTPCCLHPTVAGSALGATHFRGHIHVHCRYGPVTRPACSRNMARCASSKAGAMTSRWQGHRLSARGRSQRRRDDRFQLDRMAVEAGARRRLAQADGRSAHAIRQGQYALRHSAHDLWRIRHRSGSCRHSRRQGALARSCPAGVSPPRWGFGGAAG